MRNSGNRVIQFCQSRWEEFSSALKRAEPHSPQGLKAAMYKSHLYVDTRMNLHWIGLRFRLPLLSHPTPSWRSSGKIDQEAERRRWGTIDRNAGYNHSDAITHIMVYVFRDICREKQPEDDG